MPAEFYISPPSGSTINYSSGSLNIYIFNNNIVSITIENDSNLDLVINGNGNGKVIIKSLEEQTQVLYLNNVEVISPITFEISENVKALYINSITMKSSVNILDKTQKFNVIVNNVYTTYNINCSLSNIKINNNLTLYQKNRINNENVNFQNSTIIYEIFDLRSPNNLLIHLNNSNMDNIPKSFIFHQNYVNSMFKPKKDTDYILFNEFENHDLCEKWLNIIILNGSNFNEKYCDKRNQIYVKHSVPEKVKSKNLTRNDKIGIIVGCIGCVIFIALIIFDIIRCKHFGLDLSESP